MIKFQKEKNFKVINCDKNVGIAIISNELYDQSVLEYLNTEPAFIELLEDPLYETKNFIKDEILKSSDDISEKFRKCLLKNIENSKLGSFRLLAKLHKPIFSWRPIVNCRDHPNSNICKAIDLILKPIVIKTESYIQDSQNFIQQTKDIVFKNKPYLYSLDIVSLYTNMKALDVINRISVFMINHLNSLNLNIHGFRKLLFIMFNTNVFKVNSKYYKQIDGLPMGCICGPTVANLYVYILEKEWFKIERPLIYKRFIDDTAIALYKELNIEKFQKFFYNLKFTVNTGDCIEFLDLIISFDIITNKLKFSVHIKPTNTFGYLKVNSNHPKHIFFQLL